MHSVLMQPNWICISSDKFIDVDAINSLWSPNSHLFAIHKYKYELPFPFLFRGLLSRCELLLLFRHFCNDPQSAKRGIKWTTSASLVRDNKVANWTIKSRTDDTHWTIKLRTVIRTLARPPGSQWASDKLVANICLDRHNRPL